MKNGDQRRSKPRRNTYLLCTAYVSNQALREAGRRCTVPEPSVEQWMVLHWEGTAAWPIVAVELWCMPTAKMSEYRIPISWWFFLPIMPTGQMAKTTQSCRYCRHIVDRCIYYKSKISTAFPANIGLVLPWKFTGVDAHLKGPNVFGLIRLPAYGLRLTRPDI